MRAKLPVAIAAASLVAVLAAGVAIVLLQYRSVQASDDATGEANLTLLAVSFAEALNFVFQTTFGGAPPSPAELRAPCLCQCCEYAWFACPSHSRIVCCGVL